MNVINMKQAFKPRQVRAMTLVVLAVLGLVLAGIAFGISPDHQSLAQQVVDAVSRGPVSEAVNSMYFF